MKYLMIVVFLLSGCSLVSNSTMDKELLAKFTDTNKQEDDINFSGPRAALEYSPNIDKRITVDGAHTVVITPPSAKEGEVDRLRDILKELDAEKIRAIGERDIALKAKLVSEQKHESIIQERISEKKSSGLYYILYGCGLILIVFAFGLFLFILKNRLGIRTQAVGEIGEKLAQTAAKGLKWSRRHKLGLKSISDQIRFVEGEIAKNGISAEERYRLNHTKNYLRDLRGVLLGNLLHEDD